MRPIGPCQQVSMSEDDGIEAKVTMWANVRRPAKIDWDLAFAHGIVPAAMDADVRAAVEGVIQAQSSLLEWAVAQLIAVGWTPAELQIRHHPENRTEIVIRANEQLLRDVIAFEVTTAFTEGKATISGRWIAPVSKR